MMSTIILPTISWGGGPPQAVEGFSEALEEPLHQLRWSPSPANAGEDAV